jgi:protocatechuate 3,4-dioxygenase beta subunit
VPVVAAVGAVFALAACDGGGPATARPTGVPSPSGTSGVTSTSATAAGCPVPAPASGPVDAASVLVPGPTNGLPRSQAGGEKLVIAAVVLDPACRPATGASVRLWHTDARGRYGPSSGACCYYGGTVRTDQNGRIRLESIRPGQYPEPGAPPAHIHVDIQHPSGQLQTEIVFASTPAANVIPVALQEVSTPQDKRYWYGEAALVLGG